MSPVTEVDFERHMSGIHSLHLSLAFELPSHTGT